MKKFSALALIALAVPSLALAAKPPAPGSTQQSHGKAAPQVMYVLKGTLTAYTAASGTTPGSVTIQVSASNYHGAALKGQSLTLATSASTKLAGTITAGHKGVVKVRGPKALPQGQTLAALLQSKTAWQVVDQGAAS